MNLKVDLVVERAKRKWTQEELAKRSGVCRLTICKIENGKQDILNLRLGQIVKLAKALDIPVTEFLDEE
ncbi:MAG: helix-turn-helix transcriptional regulator [Clostridium sp.]|nr:helix-turn-helix transcriptional regulator [Clostridium sp.]